MTVNIFEMTRTWNAAGDDLEAIQMDVTDTASGVGSTLLKLLRNSDELFEIGKFGDIRIFNRSGSNYERYFQRWNSNVFQVGVERSGAGVQREWELYRGLSMLLFTLPTGLYHTIGLGTLERSVDPSDPPEGHMLMWQTDGSDTGDDGDVYAKITAGGVTKIIPVIDFSAGALFETALPGSMETFYHGLSALNNPAIVELSTLNDVDRVTGSGQEFTFSLGPATAGQYVILLVPSDHDLSALINTGTGFPALGAFTRTADVREIDGVEYISYTLGPLVEGYEATYRATLA